MKKEEFINKLKLFDSRIIEAIQCYILNERLVDWCEYKPKLKEYKGFLGPACESIKRDLYIHFTALFDGRSNIGIRKLISKIQNELWYDKRIDSIYNKYSFITRKKNNMLPCIKTMVNWRDSFIAHHDNEIVDFVAFHNLKANNKIDIENILKLLINLHNDINEIFDILSTSKRKLLLGNFNDVDLFMKTFFHENDDMPKYSFDIGRFSI